MGPQARPPTSSLLGDGIESLAGPQFPHLSRGGRSDCLFFRVPSDSKILSCASLRLGFPPVRGATLGSGFRKGSVRFYLQILVSQREPNLKMVKNGRDGVSPASPWGRGWPPQSCFPPTLAGGACLHALSTSPGENLKKLGVPRVCVARTGTLTASSFAHVWQGA